MYTDGRGLRMRFTAVLFLLDILVTVKGWPCVSPVRKVYSRVNTDAVLRFSADLTNLNSPRKFNVNFHNGTAQARITYNQDLSYTTGAPPGVTITGDTEGNVEVTLTNVQLSNAGIYTFDASGIQFSCNCLYILGTPTKPTTTLNKVPAVGESATLTCISTSTTTPSNHSLSIRYNWRVDNVDNPTTSRYVYSTNRNTLTLSNIVKDDASKQFTCTATEDVTDGYTSSRSDSFSFDVHYGPENLDFSPSDTSYEIEENTSLDPVTCGASCNPVCSLRWTKIGQVRDVSNTAVLSLGTLTGSEAGTYRCTATRSGGSTQTKDLIVNVIYGPYQSSTILSPTTQEYIRNEGTNLPGISCSADCYPDCTHTWTKMQQGKTTTVTSTSTGVLSLGNLDRDDAAIYTCTARNPGKTTSQTTTKQVTVKVRYGPNEAKINVQSPYNITEGDANVEIECSSDCYPGCSYSWTNLTSGSKLSADGTLSLGMVNVFMTGDLKCTSTNTAVQLALSSETVVTVNVRERTFVKSFYIGNIDSQTSVTADEHDVEVRFTCIVNGNAETAKIMFNGETLQEQANTNALIFIRHSIDCFHAGIYTCESRDKYGKISTRNATLFVRCSPRPLRHIRENITSPLYVPGLLRFVILAYPEPGPKGFYWYKEKGVRWIPVLSNEDFQISSSGLQSNLTILNVSQSDYGQYRVTVKNDIGTYNQYLFLLGTDLQDTRSECREEEVDQDKTAIIIAIVVGILCIVLATYATYITLLMKRNTKNKGIRTEDSSKTQSTYVNMAYKPGDTNEKGAAKILHGTDYATDVEEDTMKQYTDLAPIPGDDKMYEVIKRA